MPRKRALMGHAIRTYMLPGETLMTSTTKGRGPHSWAGDRELIALAKTMTLEAMVKKTGRKPEAILKTAKRLGIKIKRKARS
jgi:hypothetical protein